MKNLFLLILLVHFCITSFGCTKEEKVVIVPEDETIIMESYLIFENWEKRQGGAIYNDMLVCLNATDQTMGVEPNGFIYDVRTGVKLCDMTFTSTLMGKKYTMPHANQVSFSTEFYDEESDFPLLYVSQVNGGSGKQDLRGERGVLVYNLMKLSENHYEPQMVQAIMPDVTDSLLMSKLGEYTLNYIVNTDKNQLVVIGYPNDSWYDLSGAQPIVIFNIPSLSEGVEIVLNHNDIEESYTLPIPVGPQQSFYYKNKIYSAGGDRGQASIRVIDLQSQSVVFFADLTGKTKGEPQFLGLWEGKMLYYEYDLSGQVYEIILPNYHF